MAANEYLCMLLQKSLRVFLTIIYWIKYHNTIFKLILLKNAISQLQEDSDFLELVRVCFYRHFISGKYC